jgi:hypothetical protein
LKGIIIKGESAMKKLISLFFTLVLFSVCTHAADNMYTPKTQGSVNIIDNTGRIWQSIVTYTTDGNGNVLPISGGGGGGGLTDAQLRCNTWNGVLYQRYRYTSI